MADMRSSSSSVFQNRSIVQRIISFAALNNFNRYHSTTEYLKMRAVSKTFNLACLSEIRKRHRHLKIETRGQKMLIWPKLFPKKNCVDVFRFFRNVVNIHIESVEFQGDTDPRIHEDFMKILVETNKTPVKVIIGNGDFCKPNCGFCPEYVRNCKEYGPIKMDLIQNGFKQPHHFEVLRVNGRLLSEIANIFDPESINTDQSQTHLKSLLNPNISGDCLHFVFSTNSAHPLEVIHAMIEVWRVKWIHIQFRSSEVEFQSGFRFEENSSSQKYPKIQKLQKVIVDVSSSEINFQDSDPFLNLFSNVKRLFPTETLLFKGPSLMRTMVLEHLLVNILRNMWKIEEHEPETILFEIEEYRFLLNENESIWLLEDPWDLDYEEDYEVVQNDTIDGFRFSPSTSEISQKFESLVPSETSIFRVFTLQKQQKRIHFRLSFTKKGFEDYQKDLETNFQKLVFGEL